MLLLSRILHAKTNLIHRKKNFNENVGHVKFKKGYKLKE